ncbi:TetR/AcrR family transcriptional regulator C-terminal domain-containing protein [Bradyrhizobium sp. 147]|nr:TetR/AcrR family transcriptional regulator C-terminal domain-containing protein [Bradyrhizobium sp. 179]MCK1628315.1 TetR/AcrR family transcriptional regulator C-terminal domain-containing protein [Bradyrhizobium sp. 160]MCK1684050.1 TetR/AcrR family transcriptional regulator C-terminal domain-containing protein [Bradyrhizobium sp. 147]
MKSAILLVGESDIQFARVVVVIDRFIVGAAAASRAVLRRRRKPVETANPEKSGQSRYSYGGLPHARRYLRWQPGKSPIPAPMWG